MKWDYSVGTSSDGKPVMWGKHLFRLPFGWSVKLHRMDHEDPYMLFHTHMCNSIRLVLWGGYTEENLHEDHHGNYYYTLKEWSPFRRFGWVGVDYCHRVHSLHNGVSSYSLWIKGPRISQVEMIDMNEDHEYEISTEEG